MKSDKDIKKIFRSKFWKEPDKYYPVAVLEQEGFTRGICKKCGKPFWSADPDRKVCGEPACSGEGFAFIGNTPAKHKLGYIDVWKKFSRMFKKLGYTPIKRYPVVARWNPTMEYTNASIAAFQPYVISGEVEPPANPLIIPQFCLRFNDIDNVGITQSHNTGFVMIGQHMFVKPEKWDQANVFNHIYKWLRFGLGVNKSDIIFHEDAWAGGGNFGSCMEFFSKGCEIGNQVYMLYEQTQTGYKPLNIRVLDMGMGQERNAWFSQGCETIYDASFPDVIKKLLRATGLRIDRNLIKKYIPYGGLLNLDEVKNIEKAWESVAKKVGVDAKTLKNSILPLSGLYSIAEHMRSVLVALADGSLPSNVGGGYNLRVLIRRSLSFIDKYRWAIYLPDVCRWHARYLKPMYPELNENIDNVSKILDVEKHKYENTKAKSVKIIKNIISKDNITEAMLLKIYDSQGIPPDIIKEEAKKLGKDVKIPDNFYSMVSKLHEKQTQTKLPAPQALKLKLNGLPDTKILYYGDYRLTEFSANVLRVVGEYVILDRTAFYPTAGGQLHDTGYINGKRVVDVFKQGGIIVHKLSTKNHSIKEGSHITGRVDKERRYILSQHHTATHIVNAAARRTLGNHVNQAGAKKAIDKAHLDITHYLPLSPEEVHKIEKEANKIVKRGIKIEKLLLPRNVAERKFGMRIYQGGAVPGKIIRIVNIPGVDVEACGGTHLNNTKEVGKIKILKTTKIQDGVIRLEFTAGTSAEEVSDRERNLVESIIRSINKLNLDLMIDKDSVRKNPSEQIRDIARILSVQVNHVKISVEKFVNSIIEDHRTVNNFRKKMGLRIIDLKNEEFFRKKRFSDLTDIVSHIFTAWKEEKKLLEKTKDAYAKFEVKRIIKKLGHTERFTEILDLDRKTMIKIAEHIINEQPNATIILVNREGDVVGMSKKEDISKVVSDFCRTYGGSGGGKGYLAQGKIDFSKLKRKKGI